MNSLEKAIITHLSDESVRNRIIAIIKGEDSEPGFTSDMEYTQFNFADTGSVFEFDIQPIIGNTALVDFQFSYEYPRVDEWDINHRKLHPSIQGKGIGSHVLAMIESVGKVCGIKKTFASIRRPYVLKFFLLQGYNFQSEADEQSSIEQFSLFQGEKQKPSLFSPLIVVEKFL